MSKIALTTDVVDVLDRSRVVGLQLRLPEGQLERGLYVRVNLVLEALGGKWNRRERAHVFAADPSEAIEAALLGGSVVDQKKALGFFETPKALAERLVEMAGIEPGHRVLEPSAGRGRIAQAIVAVVPNVELHLVEIDPRHFESLHGIGTGTVRTADFLGIAPAGEFDRIVANPPFGKQRQDLQHVVQMHRCLRPRGVLVSVMAAGVTFRSDARSKSFRDFVAGSGGSIEALPEGSFRESGTDVSTCVVRIPKAA